MPEVNGIQFSDHIEKKGIQLFEAAQKNKLEGIIAKKLTAGTMKYKD